MKLLSLLIVLLAGCQPPLTPVTPIPPTPIPTPPTPNQILIQTGHDLGVTSLRTGRQHPVLQRMAEAHAAYQAAVQTQGHQFWAQRVERLRQQMPECREFSEVANESWNGQDVNAAAYEMYRSWKLSPGHWSAVNGRCNYWGYAMVRGKNGTWYAAGVFARG